MDRRKERIDYLLEKYLSDTLTSEEIKELLSLEDYGHSRFLKFELEELASNPPRKLMGPVARRILYSLNNEIDQLNDGVKIVPFYRKRWNLANAAILFAVILFGLYAFTIRNVTQNSPAELSFTGPRVFYLPDSTKIILNNGARLSYGDSFGLETRDVFLIGEAFFDVAHDTIHKFIVHSGGTSTTVLGTAFNVNQHNETTIVTVARGKVQVSLDYNKTDVKLLVPNDQVIINSTRASVQHNRVDAETAIVWEKNFTFLEKVHMEEAAVILSKKFGITVSIIDAEFKNCILDATFTHGEDLDEILSAIASTFDGKYKIDGHKASISGSCQ